MRKGPTLVLKSASPSRRAEFWKRAMFKSGLHVAIKNFKPGHTAENYGTAESNDGHLAFT